jgi:hypothetical protein
MLSVNLLEPETSKAGVVGAVFIPTLLFINIPSAATVLVAIEGLGILEELV